MKNGVNKTVVIVALIIGISILGYGFISKPTTLKNINKNMLATIPEVEKLNEGKIGQWVSLEGFSIVINEASWKEFDNKNSYVLLANEKNTGSIDLRCSPPSIEWKLIDKNGVAHSPTGNIKDQFSYEMTIRSNQIQPGQTVNGYVVFDIPETVIPDYLLIEPCPLTTKTDKTIKIFLNY